MNNSLFNIPLFLLISSLLSMRLPAQSPGSLDAGFGDKGMISLNWESLTSDRRIGQDLYLDQNSNTVWDAQLQPDGKILLLLSDQLIRLNPNGEIDLSFGGGVVQVTNSFFSHMALQPDGKIVVVGTYVANGNVVRLNLRRLLPDGSPDLTFGTASVVDSISAQVSQGYPLIQPDGKIVVLTSKGSTQYWLGRFNPNGSYDASFGQGGVKTIALAAGNRVDASYLRGHIAADGSIFVANSTLPANNIFAAYPQQYDLIKLKPNGSPDNSFGGGGLVHPGPVTGLLSGVLFAPDGKILFFGQTWDGILPQNPHFILRLLPDGSADETFADLGLYLSGDGVDYYSEYKDICLARQDDGKLVLARGYPYSPTVNENLPALFRLNDDGSVDQSFGSGGRATIDNSNVPLQQIIALPDGRIFVAGLQYFTSLTLPYNLFAARLFAGESVATHAPNAAPPPFAIEPNPCHNSAVLRFQADCPEGASVNVYDPLGRIVLTENLENTCEHHFNTSLWAPGVYWVDLQQGQRRWVTRLVKVE